MKTTIIADSRGAGLQEHLNLIDGIGETIVLYYPGAKAVTAVKRALENVNMNGDLHQRLVILMVGICNATQKEKSTGNVSLSLQSEGQIVEEVYSALEKAYKILLEAGLEQISVATLTGLDLEDYNCKARKQMDEAEYQTYCESTKHHRADQSVLNNAIIQINRLITGLNRNNNVPTTWTGSVVHSYFRGTYHHYYRKLQDGCHPSVNTSQEWAKKIASTIRQLDIPHKLSSSKQ